MKKILIVCLVLILIGAAVVFYLTRGGKSVKEAFLPPPKVEVTLQEDRTIEFLESKKVSEFIVSINGTISNDYVIESNSIGKKTITFDFVNDENRKATYSYEVEVKDVTPPVIWISNSYTVTEGGSMNWEEEVLCGDDSDNYPERHVEGSYDFNTVGNYNLSFVATDKSGNVSTEDFTLKVAPKPKGGGGSNSNTNTSSTANKVLFSSIVDKHKTNETKIGLDISKWQGDVDFAKLKSAGVEFVIVRVGTAEGTNGKYYLDEKFERNMEEAKANDMPVGLYFYSYANSIDHAKRDAKWVLEQIKDYEIEMPIAFDWEDWENFNSYKMSFYELTESANTFLDTITEKGYSGMLYSSKSYLERIWLPTTYPIWLANYTNQTTYEGPYMMWQQCSDGKVDGINGDVDINILYENQKNK